MKLKFSLALVLFALIISVSCSSDDEGDTQQVEKDYFPLVEGNSWDYQNVVTADDQQDIINNETLTLNNTSLEGPITTYEFETSNPANSAPVTLALSNGSVYKEGSALFYTGSIDLGIPEFSDFNFDIENGIIYDKNSSPDTEFFTLENSLQQQISGFNININYSLTSVMGVSIESLNVNNQNYDDVITSKLIVNMVITTDIGIPANFLENEQVVEITNYFAKDVGLIKSETDTNFDFISFPTVPLQDVSFFTLQELQSYSLSVE